MFQRYGQPILSESRAGTRCCPALPAEPCADAARAINASVSADN